MENTSSDITLLECLKELFPDSSVSTLRKWIKFKRVTVNDELALRGDILVSDKNQVKVTQKKTFYDDDIEILHEDPDIVVIYKPPSLLSVAKDKKEEKNVHDLLKKISTEKGFSCS